MKKNILFILLLLALLLPATALAYDFEVDGIYYNVNGNQATVTYKTTSYYSYSGNVTIPETIIYSGTEYQVTSIGDRAFYNCNNLTNITIPNSITSIGVSAFYRCMALTSVEIPNSVINIGNSAFSGCSTMTSLTIGNSVTAIGQSAFSSCSSLTNILIPNSVTTVGNSAFSGCSSITNIEFPNSVTSIGSSVCSNCSSLKCVIIGESVTQIGKNAFEYCSSLKTLYFNAINCQDFKYNENVFPAGTYCNLNTIIFGDKVTKIPAYFTYSYYTSGVHYMTNLKNLIISNTVLEIGNYAFYGCSGLTNLSIGNSVRVIGENAFSLCKGLASLIIDNSVISIGKSAFSNCSELLSVCIGNSVTSIGSEAFLYCSKLTSVTIGNSVASIGSSAFNICNNLNTIYITGEGEWNAGVLPCNSQITTLCIGSGITSVKGMKVNPLNIYCYATTPPTCDNNSFTAYRGSLHVPAASLSSYFVAPIWENFSYMLGDAVAVQSVRLSDDAMNMTLGDEEELTASVQPTRALPNDIIWSSSNSSIATVADGLVTAVGVGECDIIASCFDKRAVCHVIVRDSIAVILDVHEAQLLPNHILLLNPTVIPVSTGLTVTSSDPSVAAARVVNNQVQVVGVKEGIAVITVGSSNGTAQVDTCLVTVYTEPGDVNMDGFVNISDVTQIIDYLLGGEISIFKEANADLNGDGHITIGDVTDLIDLLLSGN